jgi:diguanylate cyclase (GGDEF)-like protein/PAS domain S-box-containing protein
MFPLISLGVIAWTAGIALAGLSSSQAESMLWDRVSTLGMDLLPFVWLGFVLLYTRRQALLPVRTLVWLILPVLISQVLVWSFPASYLYQQSLWLDKTGTYSVVVLDYNGWDWTHMLVSAVILIAGGSLLYNYAQRLTRAARIPTRLLLLGMIVPMLVYIVEISGWKTIQGFYFTPLAFCLAQIAFLLSISNQSIGEILPLARDILIERVLDAVWVLDGQGQIVDLNPAAMHLAEGRAGGVLGRTLFEIFPEWQSLITPPEGMRTTQLEVALGDGSNRRFYDIRFNPLMNPAGMKTGSLVVMHEITRQKQVQEALQESETRYRMVINHMQEGIIIQDSLGDILASNASAGLILGLPTDQIVGSTSLDSKWRIIQEDGTPVSGPQLPARLALESGQPQSNIVLGLYRPDGDLHWISMNSQPVFIDRETHPYVVVTTFVDITEEKQAEQTLRDSENRFRELMEFAPVSILIADGQGVIRMVNKQLEQITGYQRSELVGQPIEALVPEANRKNHVRERSIFVSRSGSRPFNKELGLYARRKDGSVFPADIGINTIHTSEGTLVISYVVDISERREAEEALQQANDQLKRSLHILGQHNRDLELMTEMGEMLLSCANLPEAYTVIAAFAAQLFPGCSGALYITSASGFQLESAISWGIDPPEESEFSPEMCWGLRRGRSHTVDLAKSPLLCQHVQTAKEAGFSHYMCIPLQSRSKVIGVFHLRWMDSRSEIETLAGNISKQINMTLANLSLREDLRSQSIRDPLTGLFNRRYMEVSFERELFRARRRAHSIGIVLLDIDCFKDYNDTYGHQTGDEVLRVIGDYLSTNLRGEDIVCRFGGEEFIVILPDTNLEESHMLAEKLRMGIKTLAVPEPGGAIGEISVSLGVAVYPDHGRTIDQLVKAADQALYQAKQAGRDQVAKADY